MSQSSKLFENTVCLAVTFHKAGKHRRFRRGEVETLPINGGDEERKKIDQRRLNASKQIFQSDRHAACQTIKHEFETWIGRRAVPCPLKRGTYLIPIKMLDEVYARLDTITVRYDAEADALMTEYESLKEQARRDLGSLYREDDYPSAQALRRAFWVERKLFDFSPPGEAKLSEAVYEQERERWSKTFAEAENEVRLALRESMLRLVSHLAERLTPEPDGSRKRLHASAVDKLVEFMELFDKRNILDDTELKKLVGKARQVLQGGDIMVDALKEDESVRTIVRRRMDQVQKSLDELVKSGPVRVITFEED